MSRNYQKDHAATHIDSILRGLLYGLVFFVPGIYLYFHWPNPDRWFDEISRMPVMTGLARDFKSGMALAGDLFVRQASAFYENADRFDLEKLLKGGNLLTAGNRSAGILSRVHPNEHTWERPWIEDKLAKELGRGKMRASGKFLDYIEQYMALAAEEMYLSRVPASITLAQGLLESEAGHSFLGREAKNHFGVKCLKQRDYKADGVIDDRDFLHHNLAYDCVQFEDDNKWDRFEVYASVEHSYRRHTLLLIGSKRYNWMLGTYQVGQYYRVSDKWFGTDSVPYYAAWAIGLKEGGYATSKRYAQKIAYIIETYELWRIDYMVMNAV